VDYLHDDEKILVSGDVFGSKKRSEARDIVEHLHAESARELATLESDFYSGSPIVLSNKWGSGEAIYLGARLDESSYTSFYEDLADRIGLARFKLPSGVVRKTRVGADGPVEFLFNYNRHEVLIELGDACFQRVLDGKKCRGKTLLRPYDTLLRGITLQPEAGLALDHPVLEQSELQAS
jgi:beta-galactosidase GanA